MKMNRRFRMILAVALLVAMLLPAMASATVAYVQTAGGRLNLRAQPTTASAVIASYPKGTQVEILSTSGAWCYVLVGGRYGYMNNSYLVAAGSTATAPSYTYPRPYIPTTNDGVNYYPTYFDSWEDMKKFLDTVQPSWPYWYGNTYYPYYPCYPYYPY